MFWKTIKVKKRSIDFEKQQRAGNYRYIKKTILDKYIIRIFYKKVLVILPETTN